ncbi:MAG: HTH domain-containing protein [Bacteroides sp.]|nr:HTH domain-containing protein [Bacteroides sp.]
MRGRLDARRTLKSLVADLRIARKMLLSRRTITNYISELKSLGADIRYDKCRNTYYFHNEFTLYATFEVKLST